MRCAGVPYGFFDGSFGTGIRDLREPDARRIEAGFDLQHVLQKLRTSRPAPTRSTSEIAISAATSAPRKRRSPSGGPAAAGVLQLVAGVDARHLHRGHDAERGAREHTTARGRSRSCRRRTALRAAAADRPAASRRSNPSTMPARRARRRRRRARRRGSRRGAGARAARATRRARAAPRFRARGSTPAPA